MTVLAESEQAFVEGSDSPGLTGAPSDLAALPLERVESEICTLAGQIAAATCRFLRLLAEFDGREGWAGWQVRSCAHWLSWRCGLDLRTAHEQVRVARALVKLPRISQAFGEGRLSYSKVRALTRVATAQTEADLVEAALCAPASQVERLVRGLQDAEAPGAREVKPGVQWRWDDDGCLKVWGRLDAADGARLLAGLTRMEQERTATGLESESAGSDPTSGPVAGSNGATSSGQPSGGECSAEHSSTPHTPAGPAKHADPSDDIARPAPDTSGERSAERSDHKPSVGGGAPADLGPALVAAADLACATIEMPAHAPGAEVVVHVDLDTFVQIARDLDAAEAERSADAPTASESTARPDEQLAPERQPANAVVNVGSDEDGPANAESNESQLTTSRTAIAQIGKARPTPRRPRRGRRGPARLDDGPSLRSAVLQRLACDGRIQLSVDGPDGRTLDLGRRRRRPTNRQIVALWRRDRGCAVPGCGRTRFLHAHHVRPWALGGRTSLDNLVLLCGEHHRLLHDGGFSIVALGRQRFRFYGAAGSPVPAAPATAGDLAALTAEYPDITASTIEPDWDGTNLHLADAITTYLEAWAGAGPSGHCPSSDRVADDAA